MDWIKQEIFPQVTPKVYIVELWTEDFWWPIIGVIIHLFVWYIIAQMRKDNGLIDAAWPLNYIILNFATIYLRARKGGLEMNLDTRSHLALIMTMLYGLRMFIYIIGRTKLGSEDRRFAEIRNTIKNPCLYVVASGIIWFNVSW